MIPYFGDFAEDSTVLMPFNTFSSDDPSASVTITNLADADIKVHKDGGLTQISTDGATIAIDYDGVTGNHLITIDTSVHADYSTGSDYIVRIEGTTVDAATINAFVGSFSIENRYNAAADDLANVTDGLGALRTLLLDIPTVAEFEARTLTAANYFDPTTDTVANVTTVATCTTNTDMRGTDNAALASALATVDSNVDAILLDTGTTLEGHLTDLKGATFNSATDSNEAIRDRGDTDWATGGGGGSVPTASEVADAVWDEVLSGHLTAGTTGNALNAAGSAGDPWATTLPGAYTGSQAGKLIGDNINAPIATVDTVVDGIKAVTDLLPDAGALSSLATATALATVDTVVDGIQTDLDNGTDGLGALRTLVLDVPTVSEFEARTLVAANYFDPATDTVANVTTCASNTDMRGTDNAATATALATVDGIVDAIVIDTQDIQSTLAGGLDVNVTQIAGDSTAATYLAAHTRRAVPVTFSGGSTTTAVLVNVDGAAASSTDDVYNGRLFLFSAPAALKDQVCEITDYVGSTKTATISAVTTAVSASSVAVLV